MAKRPKLFLVEWLDSAQPTPGWRYLEDAPAPEAIHCMSVGWLISENGEAIVLAPNVAELGGDSAQGSGYIRIPVAAITRRCALRYLPRGRIRA